jgi:glutamate racemase
MSLETRTDGRGLTLGLFDSGLGGLSVLSAIREALPMADMVYVADSAHAPYGEKTDAYIADRSRQIAQFLLTRGADVLVVACNTATAAAVHELRQQWPEVPVVGIEPGIKPALAASGTQCIGVLATPATLRSQKLQRLIETHGQGAQIVLQACPGLAKEIELGALDSPRLRELVESFSAPVRQAKVDTVVLGCTHYPFVAPLFQQALGEHVRLIDTAHAVARHTARLGQALHASATRAAPKDTRGLTELWSSADPALLTQVAQRWLGLNTQSNKLLF